MYIEREKLMQSLNLFTQNQKKQKKIRIYEKANKVMKNEDYIPNINMIMLITTLSSNIINTITEKLYCIFF